MKPNSPPKPPAIGGYRESFLICQHEDGCAIFQSGIPVGYIKDGRFVRDPKWTKPLDEISDAFLEAGEAIGAADSREDHDEESIPNDQDMP